MPITPKHLSRAARILTLIPFASQTKANSNNFDVLYTGAHYWRVLTMLLRCTSADFATGDCDIDIGYGFTGFGGNTTLANAYADGLNFGNSDRKSFTYTTFDDVNAGVQCEHIFSGNKKIIVPPYTMLRFTNTASSGAGVYAGFIEVLRLEEIPPIQVRS